MYSYLSGKLIKIVDCTIVLDVNGIGYEIHIPLRTLGVLPQAGSPLMLYTYFHVREDAQLLYGFKTEEDRELFKMLLGVTGIGPKLALSILSGIGPREFKGCIEERNDEFLSSIPGIGSKTASRLILELKEKIRGLKVSESEIKTGGSSKSTEIIRDAILALISLGFPRPQAQVAIERVIKNSGGMFTVEKLVKESIKEIN